MIVQNKIEYRIILGMHLSPVNLDMGYIEMFIKIKNVLMGLHCMFEFKKMSFLPLKYFSSFRASLFRSKAISIFTSILPSRSQILFLWCLFQCYLHLLIRTKYLLRYCIWFRDILVTIIKLNLL